MISLIILADNNSQTLPAVLKSLYYQTYSYFEVVLIESGQSHAEEVLTHHKIDQPIRYLRATGEQNEIVMLDRAVLESSGNYLICIRGDRVLHHKFIEEHKRLGDPDEIVTGSFVALGTQFTKSFSNSNDYLEMQNTINDQRTKVRADGAQAIEEAIYTNPHGLRGMFRSFRTAKQLDAGNMSFFKHAYEDISEFESTPTPDLLDTFLQKQFLGEGFSLRSARNFAVQYKLKA